MKKSLILSLTAAAAMLPSTAMAQAFEGPYIGAQIGWNQDNVESSAATTGSVAVDQNRDAFVGGVFAGYDHHIAERVVIGAEAGFQVGADDAIVEAGGRYAIDPRYAFDLSARAGYVVGDKTLIYARGGYSNVRARVRSLNATTPISETGNLDGWFVGGGVERKLTDSVSARVEYRYHDLGEQGDTFERHQVLAGVAFRF